MNAVQVRNVFEKAKWLDIQAGHLLGNADHVRALGMTATEYVMIMAVRVFVAGLSIAFLSMTFVIVVSLGDASYSTITSLAFGLSLYCIAQYLYPREGAFHMAFVLLMSSFALIYPTFLLPTENVLGYALYTLSWTTIPTSFGLLFALYLVSQITFAIQNTIKRIGNSTRDSIAEDDEVASQLTE